jgi:hypothetical protein
MALNFPNSPTTGQMFSDPTAGDTWKWDGSKWEAYSTPGAYQGPPGPPGPTGPPGPQGIPGATTYQTGPGLRIDTTTTPQTMDVATPYLALTGGQMSGQISTRSSTGGIAQPNPTTGLMVYGAGGAGDAAYMVLHRPGYFAVAFGLDTDNQLAYGGWSLGSGRRVLWDTNNFNPGSYLPLSGGSISGGLTTSGGIVSNGGQIVIYNSNTVGFHVQNAGGSWVRMYDDGSPHIEISGGTLYINYNTGAQVYTGGTANVGDLFSRANINTLGSLYCNGPYVYMGGSGGGNVNGAGGPLIYADGNYMVFKMGGNNSGFSFRQYNATTLFSIDGSGNAVAQGYVRSVGGNAILQFDDRTGGFTWGWYGTSSAARLWSSADGDRVTIDRGGNISAPGGLYCTGEVSGSHSLATAGYVWVNGCQWQNNGGWMYSPQSVQTNGNFQANGGVIYLAGMYWQNNNGYMYCPWPIHTDNYINIAGLVWSNNGGYMYCGTALLTAGVLPYNDNGVSCGLTGNAWAQCAAYWFNNPSSRSEKDDIVPLSSGALDKMRALRPVTFLWKHGDNRKRHSGFIADEVATVMGEDFGGYEIDEKGREGIAYHELTAVLWKACQEMAERIANLEARLA